MTPTGVGVRVRVHEPAVVQAYQSAQHDLLIRHHYQQLDDTGTTYASSCFLVNSLTAGENHALVDGYLGGLSPEMPHPIRVQFYQRLQDLGYAAPRARPGSRDSEFTGAATMVTSAPAAAPVSLASSTLALASSSPDDAGPVGPMHIDQGDHAIVPVGEPCGWYYTATRSYSIVGTARGTLVRRGLYQAYLSGLGYTGYRGSLAPDGTHFGADLGENWCSEFYGGVASFELEGMWHRSTISEVRAYFEEHGAYSVVDHPCVFVFAAQTGDELAMDTNEDGSKNHSGMCIAFDAAAGRVWSVEGNVSGRSGLGDNYESRRAGNEAFVLDREPDAVMGHGFVDAGMLV